MLKSQMITSKHYFLISVLEDKKANLKPDEKIIWEMDTPRVIKKGWISLWFDKMLERVSTVGLKYKIKRRVK